jgi:hypothetical protein
MNELKEKMLAWMAQAKDDLINNYNRMGLRASGKFARELEPIVSDGPLSVRAYMLSAPHAFFMENGRRPTRNQGNGNLRELIRAWIDNKGIIPRGISKDSLAYIITRKIHKEGIKVPNQYNSGGVISNVITNERINKLVKEITPIFSSYVKSETIKVFR